MGIPPIEHWRRAVFHRQPTYIFKRNHEPSPALTHGLPEARTHLDTTDTEQLTRSDTAWFASAGPHGVDVTHRGGKPGFIRVTSDHTLVIPDYFGNGMFNTLGNLVLDDRLAISDVDLDTGRVLHLTGRAKVVATGADEPGAQREVHFALDEARTSIAPVGTWTDVQASRYNPPVLIPQR